MCLIVPARNTARELRAGVAIGQATAHARPGLGLDWRQNTTRPARGRPEGHAFEDISAIQGIAPHFAGRGFDDRFQERGSRPAYFI